MKSLIRILYVFAVLAFAVAMLSVPTMATSRIKTASGYGDSDSLGNTLSAISDCANSLTSHPDGCQAYYSFLDPASITINGSTTTVNEYEFSDSSSADGGVTFDVYDLGAGNYTNVNVALGGSILGVFACGGSQSDFSTPSQVSYSTNNPNFGVPCSPILASATGASSTLDAGGMPFVFTLNSDGSVTFGSSNNPIPSGDDLVVYTEANVTTPEPATLTLMGLGLVALAGLLVRRAS